MVAKAAGRLHHPARRAPSDQPALFKNMGFSMKDLTPVTTSTGPMVVVVIRRTGSWPLQIDRAAEAKPALTSTAGLGASAMAGENLPTLRSTSSRSWRVVATIFSAVRSDDGRQYRRGSGAVREVGQLRALGDEWSDRRCFRAPVDEAGARLETRGGSAASAGTPMIVDKIYRDTAGLSGPRSAGTLPG
jgi:hypothetical protein